MARNKEAHAKDQGYSCVEIDMLQPRIRHAHVIEIDVFKPRIKDDHAKD